MSRQANERTLRTAALLGVDSDTSTRAHAARVEELTRHALRLSALLRPGCVALITGPSGTGKSTLLNLLAHSPNTVTVKPLTPSQSRARVAALCTRTPLRTWTSLLARFGLSEATVLTAQAAHLSTGERARLELALAAARCERPTPRATGHAALSVTGASDSRDGPHHHPTLIIDEWCSLLDRTTATSVAAAAARWARQHHARLIGATAHDDLTTAIKPDLTITLSNQGEGDIKWTGCGLSKAG